MIGGGRDQKQRNREIEVHCWRSLEGGNATGIAIRWLHPSDVITINIYSVSNPHCNLLANTILMQYIMFA
jgi:hypothetical protein